MNRPRVLLLDEPLGALDLKLREEMQIELKAIQQQVGITFIYVTHDQEEALTMSDRLAVFNRGRIEQVGAAGRRLRAAGDRVRGRVRRDVEPAPGRGRQAIVGEAGTFTVRPEKIRLGRAGRRGRRRRDLGARAASAASSTSAPTPASSSRLDAGAELVVTQQNLVTSSTDALALEGKAVRLIWKRQHNYRVADSGS